MNTRNDFGKLAQLFYQQGSGAEIGVQYGIFSKLVSKDWTGRIVCVDIWPDREVFEVAQSMLDGPQFELWRKPSIEAAADFQDGGFDWVYIDADHHYEAVTRDLEAWFPKVRPGGILAGHDYVNYLDMEVIRAVDDFAARNGYRIALTTADQPFDNTLFPTWWFVK